MEAGKKLNDQFHTLKENDINFLVYNFVDMLSHARTEMEVIRELADDESAYRSITMSWFEHSPLLDIIKQAADAQILREVHFMRNTSLGGNNMKPSAQY